MFLAKKLVDMHIQIHVDDDFLRSLYNSFEYGYQHQFTALEPLKKIATDDCGSVKIIDIEHDSIIKMFSSGHSSIKFLRLWESANKLQIITAGCDMTIKVFDLDGRVIRKIENPHNSKRITSMIVSKNDPYEGTLIISGGEDNVIRVWSLKTAKMKFELVGHLCPILSICLCTGKSNRLLIASIDRAGQIRLWDRHNGNCLRIF